MATIITRVFQDEAAAQSAAKRVVFRGIPERAVKVITGGDPEELSARMAHADVHESAIPVYARHLGSDQALLVVRATYKPLGAARITREELAKRETLDVGEVVDDHFIPDGPERAKSVLKSHPRFFTMPLGRYARGRVTEGMGFKTIIRKSHRRSASMTGTKVSRAFWPMPLLSSKERSIKVSHGHKSKLFWPMPLLWTGKRRKSVIHDAGPVFSRTVDWPTT
jgi:hypothetical protein